MTFTLAVDSLLYKQTLYSNNNLYITPGFICVKKRIFLVVVNNSRMLWVKVQTIVPHQFVLLSNDFNSLLYESMRNSRGI